MESRWPYRLPERAASISLSISRCVRYSRVLTVEFTVAGVACSAARFPMLLPSDVITREQIAISSSVVNAPLKKKIASRLGCDKNRTSPSCVETTHDNKT